MITSKLKKNFSPRVDSIERENSKKSSFKKKSSKNNLLIIQKVNFTNAQLEEESNKIRSSKEINKTQIKKKKRKLKIETSVDEKSKPVNNLLSSIRMNKFIHSPRVKEKSINKFASSTSPVLKNDKKGNDLKQSVILPNINQNMRSMNLKNSLNIVSVSNFNSFQNNSNNPLNPELLINNVVPQKSIERKSRGRKIEYLNLMIKEKEETMERMNSVKKDYRDKKLHLFSKDKNFNVKYL